VASAPPVEQRRLLDLQASDATLDRLAAQRRTLPELAEIAEAERRVVALREQEVTLATELTDVSRGQSRLEGDVEQVRSRAARDQKRLDDGQVSSSRELENLQSEIASLRRRQEQLEEELLELMQGREDAETRLAGLRAQRAEAEEAYHAVVAHRDEAYARIDEEAEQVRARREALAPTLPADLVVLYERLRASNGGVGAAALVRHRCEGCHLELSGMDLSEVRVAAADEVLRCPECSRILVRTEESGL
jgi:predicted  nucleic acid-binding Zn-ribbon protein